MRSDQHGMSMAYFGWLRLKGDQKQLFKSQSRFFDLVRFSFCSPKVRGEVKSAWSGFFSLLIAVLTIKVLKSMVVCRLCYVNRSGARVLGRLTCNE